MVSNILNTGLQGIRQGVQGAEKAASQIARVGQPTSGGDNNGESSGQSGDLYSDLAEPLVDLKLYETSVKASAKVVKVADEVIGTLLDIKA
ncbi:hypothetical protein [Hahella ganghwensis]|uniref:hypothetical protein n=1 Tax=Hahella ganghwensis TaxID=286420 RepID=UPI000379E318|nr:hypothetical protein [Hahella ganghwensis]